MRWSEARVGMRVKLVRPFNISHMNAEGTIFDLEFTPKGTYLPAVEGDYFTPSDSNCSVLWDDDPRFPHIQHTDQLEPIQPIPSEEEILNMKGLQDEDCPVFEFAFIHEEQKCTP